MKTTTLLLTLAALAVSTTTANAASRRDICFDMLRRGEKSITYEDCMRQPAWTLAGRAANFSRVDGEWDGYEGSPRDRAWVESCRPSLVADRHGMQRYVYAKPGCETGDPQ